MEEQKLTSQEQDFCDLYVNGGFGTSGDQYKCYEEAFGSDNKKQARKLLGRQDIKDQIKFLVEEFKNNEENRSLAVKIQVTDVLQKVMIETSTDTYTTPKGHKLSPAPLRSVAVNAAKALAEMYVTKPAQAQKLQIEGGEGGGGITFNVIVPKAKTDEENTTKQD